MRKEVTRMQKYNYAIYVIDEHNTKICKGVMSTDYEIIEENYIPVPIFDNSMYISLIGKMWNGSEWVDNPNPPIYLN